MQLINSNLLFRTGNYLAVICMLLNVLTLERTGMLFLLPLSYLFCSILIRRAYNNSSYNLSQSIICILLFIRLVALPGFNLIDDYYIFAERNITASIFNEAIGLCIYESIVLSVFLYAMTNNRYIKNNSYKFPKQRVLSGNTFIYFIFILFAIVVALTVGRHMHLFDFVFKTIGEDNIRDDETMDAVSLLIRQIVSSGLLFSFFIFTEKCRRKYNYFGSRSLYLNLNILFALFLVCLITGERRTSQVYTAFASMWLLTHIYYSEAKKIIKYILACAIFVLAMLTIYKHFYAFLYDSYWEAIQHGNSSNVFSTSSIDSYFYGIGTLSKNLDFAHNGNVPFFTCIYDFFRNLFGVNFVVPRGIHTTLETYNLYVYLGEKSNGFLMSSAGYGYVYFGFLFAPILTCINVAFMFFLERKLKTCTSIEMTYLWAIVFMRFSFGALGCYPPLLNMCSRYLIMNGLIYCIGNINKISR